MTARCAAAACLSCILRFDGHSVHFHSKARSLLQCYALWLHDILNLDMVPDSSCHKEWFFTKINGVKKKKRFWPLECQQCKNTLGTQPVKKAFTHEIRQLTPCFKALWDEAKSILVCRAAKEFIILRVDSWALHLWNSVQCHMSYHGNRAHQLGCTCMLAG